MRASIEAMLARVARLPHVTGVISPYAAGARAVSPSGTILALASAVLLDALVIRTLLLPAFLKLLGPRTWWYPRWLARRTPPIAVKPKPRRLPQSPSPCQQTRPDDP